MWEKRILCLQWLLHFPLNTANNVTLTSFLFPFYKGVFPFIFDPIELQAAKLYPFNLKNK
jgi:hypothetical protein